MQNTTNLCPEIIGANIRGLVESLAGDAVFQLINTTNIIGNQSPTCSINQWRAMQVAKLPKHRVEFDNQIAHL